MADGNGMDAEWRRLQALYASMGDADLLELMAQRAELMPVAQEAVDAEAAKRGLKLVEPEMAEVRSEPDGADAARWMLLTTFDVAGTAERAARLLEEAGIEFRLEDGALGEETRRARPTWISLWVDDVNNFAAMTCLREGMGWFPNAEADRRADGGKGGEDALFGVGSFASDDDAAEAGEALRRAGVWFKAEKLPVDADFDGGTPAGGYTFVEVRFEDAERAMEVVAAAFED